MRPPRWMIRALGRLHAAVYRASGGRLLHHVGAMPMLLLTTTGRRTGRLRTVPLLYVVDGDSWAVTGSQGGHDVHPGWVANLRAAPDAAVQVGQWSHRVRAVEVDPDTHVRLWPLFVARYPAYEEYRARTDRPFAIFLLTRQSGG